MDTSPRNTISKDRDDYYISYNTRDYFTYGGVTTALVIGEQMDACYILLGDHRKAYDKLDTLAECMQYFGGKADTQLAPYSDEIGKPTALERLREQRLKREKINE